MVRAVAAVFAGRLRAKGIEGRGQAILASYACALGISVISSGAGRLRRGAACFAALVGAVAIQAGGATAAPADRGSAAAPRTSSGTSARCTVLGTRRADVLVGTRRADVYFGRGGNDVMHRLRKIRNEANR